MEGQKAKRRLWLSATSAVLAFSMMHAPVAADEAEEEIYVNPIVEGVKALENKEVTTTSSEDIIVDEDEIIVPAKEESLADSQVEEETPEAQVPGPVLEDGELHLYDAQGKLRKDNAWVTLAGKSYFPNDQGLLYRSRFISFGEKTYYMDSDGAMAKGFREVDGKLYYLDSETGLLHKDNKWTESDRGWIFPNAQGLVYRNQFISFGPELSYYLDNFGSPIQGMVLVQGTAYRMTGKAGARLVQAGPYSYEGKDYYADAKGNPVRNQEISLDGQTYFYGPDGARVYQDVETSDYHYQVNAATGAVEKKEAVEKASDAPLLYSLKDLRFHGVIRWSGYKFTYYSQSVLPGNSLSIPGRHVNEAGYVADGDGYIVLANDAPKGTIIPTPFGYYGKVYDRGTSGNHFDVYTK